MSLIETIRGWAALAALSSTFWTAASEAVTGQSAQSPPPGVLAAAKSWFRGFQTGNIDRSQLDDRMNSELTDVLLRQEGARLRPFGSPISFEYLGSEPEGDATGFSFFPHFQRNCA
jgi:hypothetical protein